MSRIVTKLEEAAAGDKEQDDMLEDLGQKMKNLTGKVQRLIKNNNNRQEGGGNDNDSVSEVMGYCAFALAFIVGNFLKNQYRLLSSKTYQILFLILLCLLAPSFISNQHGFFFWFLTIIFLMLNP